jgi:hypothetical protein
VLSFGAERDKTASSPPLGSVTGWSIGRREILRVKPSQGTHHGETLQTLQPFRNEISPHGAFGCGAAEQEKPKLLSLA